MHKSSNATHGGSALPEHWGLEGTVWNILPSSGQSLDDSAYFLTPSLPSLPVNYSSLCYLGARPFAQCIFLYTNQIHSKGRKTNFIILCVYTYNMLDGSMLSFTTIKIINQGRFYTLDLYTVIGQFAKHCELEKLSEQQWFVIGWFWLTKLIVDRWCGGLLHFTGHGACYAALATSLTVGSASSLDSHSWFFVLCIFSGGVIPANYISATTVS